MKLRGIKSIHFTGIKGVGMTALALCAQDMGKKITGSDTDETFPTSAILKQRKIRPKVGFNDKHVPRHCQLLIYTGAHGGATNPEVLAAQKRQIPVLSHAQALALFTHNHQTIATAGVGGKSTTAALLATLLDSAALRPSFAVGVGNIPALKTPGRYVRRSPWFVVESDEYVTDPQADPTPRFHYLHPHIIILTNLEHDHPDVYPTLKDMFKSFTTFINRLPDNGLLVANIDNPHIQPLLKSVSKPVTTYGFSPQADWQIVKHHLADKKQFFTLKHKTVTWPDFILNLPGKFNLMNAAAAAAVAHHLGVSPEKIKAGLKLFTGTKRRFEYIGQAKGIQLYDDYAHHPSEIKALLQAAKQWFPGHRLTVVFQSHTYSRTKALLDQFARSFVLADQVIINKIFSSARETDTLGISGQILAQAVKKYHPHVNYCSGQAATVKFLADHSRKGDIIFTVGAGNNFLWHKAILKALRQS